MGDSLGLKRLVRWPLNTLTDGGGRLRSRDGRGMRRSEGSWFTRPAGVSVPNERRTTVDSRGPMRLLRSRPTVVDHPGRIRMRPESAMGLGLGDLAATRCLAA